MSPKQEALYWREWGALSRRCKTAAEPVPDRHDLHAKALGADKSHKGFSNADFDKVLGIFRAHSQPSNIDAQVRQIEQPTTRNRCKIHGLLKCLGLYVAAPEGYAREVIRDLVNSGSLRNVTDLEDLSDEPRTYGDSDGCLIERPSQLDCLKMTLSARLNVFRNAAGDTLHEMKVKAGVKCDCAPCKRARATHERQPARRRAPEPAQVAHDDGGNPVW